jgi:hypothetical protein
MGGGLMQLVAYGAQDIYLTGNPQITFFKVVYRRHTNFSMETIEQTIQGTSKLADVSETSGTVTISRNGDLVYKVYVTSETLNITDGDSIVSQVDLEIGGQLIDRQYKEWMQIWEELSTPAGKAMGLKAMKGCLGVSGDTGPTLVQIPLQFWFCRNPGLALPLIALQYHEVKLKFTFGSGATEVVGAPAAVKVWADYIYLDTDERRRFAQVSHEYLIEQVQREQPTGAAGSKELNFNHPVKELIWTSDQGADYTDAKLVLNGHDRFSAQKMEYFTLRQPYDYHTIVPGQNIPSAHAQLHAPVIVAENQQATGNGDTTTTFYNSESSTVQQSTRFTVKVGNHYQGTNELAKIRAKIGNIVRFMRTVAGAEDHTDPAVNLTIEGEVVKVVQNTNSSSYEIHAHDPNGNRDIVESDGTHDLTSFAIIGTSRDCRTSRMNSHINVYSFALKPEEHQPSGTCNFSRIDSAMLEFTADVLLKNTDTFNIYAVNYNVLRIMSGMGGLAYSN